tara:strand:+ start:505 stop:825 length:321 start_codon:yes stop_codon:yes gene_type:complete
MIALVRTQTDYTDDIIKEKLAKHNNNYINVIKEYMGITEENSAYNKYNNDDPKTINQGIFKNIREFMDTNIREYEERKRIQEYNKKVIELQKQIQQQNDNIKITEN